MRVFFQGKGLFSIQSMERVFSMDEESPFF